MYQLSNIIINYLEIPNAILNTYWTGNQLREGCEGEEVRVQVYGDEYRLRPCEPNSNVNGGSQGFDQRHCLEGWHRQGVRE